MPYLKQFCQNKNNLWDLILIGSMPHLSLNVWFIRNDEFSGGASRIYELTFRKSDQSFISLLELMKIFVQKEEVIDPTGRCLEWTDKIQIF